MNNTLRHIFAILALFLTFTISRATTAEEILSKAADKYRNSPSLTADFIVKANGSSSNGTIIIAKDRFHLSTPQLETWYDGQTQWTYVPDTGEVNITEPTTEELQQVNPFSIVSSFRESYNSKMLKSTKGTHRLQLIPRSKDLYIRKAILTLDAGTSFPKEITITLDNNRSVNIIVSNVKAGGKVAGSRFTFDKKKYPDAEIIDLR